MSSKKVDLYKDIQDNSNDIKFKFNTSNNHNLSFVP